MAPAMKSKLEVGKLSSDNKKQGLGKNIATKTGGALVSNHYSPCALPRDLLQSHLVTLCFT